MNDDDKAASAGKRLTVMADFLFMPMVFYVLTQWERISSWQGQVLWCALFILIQNELLSVRDTYSIYRARLYLLDLTSVVLFLLACNALVVNAPDLGYAPSFWIYMGFLWFFYALWDFVMAALHPDAMFKRDLAVWGYAMLTAAAFTWVCAFLIFRLRFALISEVARIVFYLAQVGPCLVVLWAVWQWIKGVSERFRGLQAAGSAGS